jgi:hypothetical protein
MDQRSTRAGASMQHFGPKSALVAAESTQFAGPEIREKSQIRYN